MTCREYVRTNLRDLAKLGFNERLEKISRETGVGRERARKSYRLESTATPPETPAPETPAPKVSITRQELVNAYDTDLQALNKLREVHLGIEYRLCLLKRDHAKVSVFLIRYAREARRARRAILPKGARCRVADEAYLPHRQLRKEDLCCHIRHNPYLPHRQLRNRGTKSRRSCSTYLPHRQLRKF